MTAEVASTRALRTACRVAGALVVLVAVVVLVGGWELDVADLRSIVPGTVGMKALTAIGLAVAAVAMLLLSAPGPRWRAWLARACALLVLALGAAVLGEYVLGWRLGIDELLFVDHRGRALGIAYPGRFAPTTAVCLVLVGLAQLTVDLPLRRRWPVTELLLLPVLVIAGLTVVGYLYAIPSFYGPASAAKMAINTGACFLALAAGTLVARPRSALVRLVLTDDPGGTMMRRLLPLAIALPLLLGWTELQLGHAGVFGHRIGTWWLTVSTIVVLSLLIWRVAAQLSAAAADRRHLATELRRLADHDGLTGLVNRRRFDEELASAASRALRGGPPSSLMIIDLDRMKRVNDQLGHAAGDALLRAIGAVLRHRTRASDVSARLGGDEFAVLLHGTTAAAGTVLADDLRAVVLGCRIPTARGEAHTTLSIGIAELGPAHATAEAVLVAADEAMYASKRAGGDRVSLNRTPAPATPVAAAASPA